MKTEEEIIKALDCCSNNVTCLGCPYSETDHVGCVRKVLSSALNLIRKQQAEIERLNTENNRNFDKWIILEERTKKRYAELYQEAMSVVRNEAVKEFVERLKNKHRTQSYITFNGKVMHEPISYTITDTEIDDLVKETVNVMQPKLSKKEFIEKHCSVCGSQRCEGIGTEWFEGCKYKKFLQMEGKK